MSIRDLPHKALTWPWTLRTNFLTMKALGLWPDGDGTYRLNSYTLWTMVSFFVISFTYNFFAVCNMFVNPDLQNFAATIFITLTMIISAVKSFNVIKNMKNLKVLAEILTRDLFVPRRDRHRAIIEDGLMFWNFTTCSYWFFGYLDMSLLCMAPILDGSVKQKTLPYSAWYPFDTKQSPHYELAYFYQCFCVFFLGMVIMTVDNLINLLNTYVALECDILCDDLRNLFADASPDGVKANLIGRVGHHRKILSFQERSSKFFNFIVFTQFSATAVSTGVGLFQLTMAAPFSMQFYSLVGYVSAIVMEIFCYSWFGNQVLVKSGNITQAIFESDWMNASPQLKRSLLILMCRCQKPITVTALKVFDLTLAIFIKILRTSYSYFAVLRQIYS